jgi:pimeloyl-ACP methyl ester carboxylesterase
MNLYHQSTGEGKPLIIIHGLFGSADNWRSLAKYFAKFCHVISIDLRNHGRSPHDDAQNFSVMADDLFQLCNTLSLEKVTVLGHSLGGKVAMQFAERYPETLDKLIVVDISPREYEGGHTPMMDAMMAIDMQQIQSRSEVDAELAKSIEDKSVRQFLLMNLVSEDDRYRWRINLPVLKANYREYMKAVCENMYCQHETLFIYGENSDYVMTADIAQIKTIFENVTFVSMPTGHWVHAERPQQFKQIVEDFLNHD